MLVPVWFSSLDQTESVKISHRYAYLKVCNCVQIVLKAVIWSYSCLQTIRDCLLQIIFCRQLDSNWAWHCLLGYLFYVLWQNDVRFYDASQFLTIKLVLTMLVKSPGYIYIYWSIGWLVNVKEDITSNLTNQSTILALVYLWYTNNE